VVYDISYFLLKWICRFFFRLRVVGGGNVPRTGPLILASNHVSYLDPIFLGVSLPRKANYMAKEEIFTNPPISWFLGKLQAYPVSRNRVNSSSIRRALDLLKKGRVLLLFPEGTRGDGRTLQKAKPGIAIIGEKSGAPMVPVFLQGPEKVLPRGSRRIRLHKVTVHIGAPIIPQPSSRPWESKRQDHASLVDQVMARIEAMKRNVENDGQMENGRETSPLGKRYSYRSRSNKDSGGGENGLLFRGPEGI
jgi:1-acyl-sn-glycerol-3-phosphate acyltransferase